MAQDPVMPGVSCQALRVHYGNAVAYRIAVDRRDCWPENPIELPHEFTCTHLVHFTENEFAASIGLSDRNSFTFQARPVPITYADSFRLTWWSPLPPNDWKTVIQQNLPNAGWEHYDIGNSSAFSGESLCGPMGIVVSWKDIMEEYAISRRSSLHNVELRVLGTFLYRKEIMYAVLVCIGGDTGVETFPLINAGDGGTEAFVRTSATDFIWRTYSTVGYHGVLPEGVTWTWDHLSFGFHCPDSDLNIRNRFCGIRGEMAQSRMPLSRSDGNRRRSVNMLANAHIVYELRRKITSALNTPI